MPMRPSLQAIVLTIFLFAPCGAAQARDEAGETGRVAVVENAVTFRLASGLTVRLAGVTAPADDAAATQSASALRSLIKGETVMLRYGGERRDRYGRAVAQVRLAGEGGEWVEGEMVSGGWLMAESVASDAGQARALQALERTAREAGRGHWGCGVFAARAPDPNGLAQHLDQFQIVEGIVVEAAQVRDWTYLNFGMDYRTDFTVAIHKDALALFEESGVDPVALSGARIRVRGWLEPRNGPMITVDHPEQIKVLD